MYSSTLNVSCIYAKALSDSIECFCIQYGANFEFRIGPILSRHRQSVNRMSVQRPRHRQSVNEMSVQRPQHRQSVNEMSVQRPRHRQSVNEMSVQRPRHRQSVNEMSVRRPRHRQSVNEMSVQRKKQDQSACRLVLLLYRKDFLIYIMCKPALIRACTDIEGSLASS
jgi:hypothetical protein